MKSTRRSMLCAGGVVVGSVLAGCTGNDETVEGQPPSDTPVPLIADQRSTQPELIDVNDEQGSDGQHQFGAQIYNSGPAGNVGVALVWLEDESADVYDPGSEVADVRETEFDEQESLEVTFSAAFPDEYEAFGFRVWSGTIEADVRNRGGAGTVLVRLLDGEDVIEETELTMDAGETTTVEFDGDYSELDFEDVTIETSIA